MANKFLLEDEDFGSTYELSNSEDDLDEEEKKLLRKFRNKKQKKRDTKQELFAFSDKSDEETENGEHDIMEDSDIEGKDDAENIPDAKAWGKDKRSYYNTDFVDQDYSTYNQREEDEAYQEEQEAKAIQKRLAEQLEEADFFLDIEQTEVEDMDVANTDGTTLKADLNDLSQREKVQLFHKDSPEFAGLVNDFEIYIMESKNLLSPIVSYAHEKDLKHPIIDFAETRNNIILTYCINVSFYLLLKRRRLPVKYHPVIKRLAQIRKLILQLQDKFERIVKPELEKLLERIKSGTEIIIEKEPTSAKKKMVKLGMLKSYDQKYEDKSMENRDELNENSSGVEELKVDDDEEIDREHSEQEPENDDERRGITYQIAKNKGLTPHRKKEQRNPRVKHRNKFRKALIRRKGAVRTVRTETKRYRGEPSGIKATVKKGIKIKS